LQLSQEQIGNGTEALSAIDGKDQLRQQIELAKGVREIGEAAEGLAEVVGDRRERDDAFAEDAASKAFEANTAGERRRWDGPDPIEIPSVGDRLPPEETLKSEQSRDIGGPQLELQIRLAEGARMAADRVRDCAEQVISRQDDSSERSVDSVRQQAGDAAKQVESKAADMEKGNWAFLERIKNDPVERQQEQMAARVDAQVQILTEKAEAAITEIERAEPALEAPPPPVREPYE
jgi:hypothetical protein